ncbi:hypothetical protein SSX86_013999 [Deinandra increscens subsp. villosa]|uniref:FHA domain-containing protein n=1 Tax=Deinandra increscens subsp. villosa TaxID=3103831 RepID=A0AAP0GYX8_9ASTR
MEDSKDIQTQAKEIPAFTVLKNGSILKNIFLLRQKSAAAKSSPNQDPDEEILLFGRHPNCQITLEHPSISRYHLRIHSNPSSHTLSVVDLSSVHGTWVSGRRIEPGVHVVLKEGDTVKIGGSSRVYELHWVPLTQAYDGQFVPTFDTIKEGKEEEMHQDDKHNADSSDYDVEGSDVSLSNWIHDSPLKVVNPLTSSVPNCFCSDTVEEHSQTLRTVDENDDNVSIQAPIDASETTSATDVSDSLNNSEDQLNWLRDDLIKDLFSMPNCSESSCDDTAVEHPSPWRTGNQNGSPLKTFNENDESVSIQAPLVAAETTSPTDDSNTLNNSKDQLNWLRDDLIKEDLFSMPNCSESSCDDTAVEHPSPWRTGNQNGSPLKTFNENDESVSIQAPLVAAETTSPTDDSNTLNNSKDQLNWLRDNLIKEDLFSMPNCSESSCDDTEVEDPSPWKTGNQNGEVFPTVSIQGPVLVSEAISETEITDCVNKSEDEFLPTAYMNKGEEEETHQDGDLFSMPNCSKSSCDDTEVGHPSPRKTGNENTEVFTTVSTQGPVLVSEAISETKISDRVNKSEDELNWLRDNGCNEFDHNSPGTIKDDLVSIDLFSAIKTHEKDSLGRDIERSNETDTVNENEPENQQKNTGSVPFVIIDGVNTDAGCEFEQMNCTKMMDESASLVLSDGVDMGFKSESVDHEMLKEENSVFVFPDVMDMGQEKTLTPDTSKDNEVHMNLQSVQNLSVSKNLFNSVDGKELEFYTPDKENKNPNACSGKALSKKAVNPTLHGEKDIFGFSQKLFAMDEGINRELSAMDEEMNTENKVDPFMNSEEVLASSLEKENKSRMEGSCNSVVCPQNLAKKRWTMVVDTNSLLDHKSLKHLKLLEGIKGTRLFVPKIVVKELMEIKSEDSYFKRSSQNASLALKWIDECMMNTRWWIHEDDETVHSSIAVPEVLEIALRLRKETDQKIIILTNNLTLKIKAMAEGIMCEAAEEFHESLVNPFSKRFMWVGSSARGLTWSCVHDDHDIVRQKYYRSGSNGSKGLKLLARVNHVTS